MIGGRGEDQCAQEAAHLLVEALAASAWTCGMTDVMPRSVAAALGRSPHSSPMVVVFQTHDIVTQGQRSD